MTSKAERYVEWSLRLSFHHGGELRTNVHGEGTRARALSRKVNGAQHSARILSPLRSLVCLDLSVLPSADKRPGIVRERTTGINLRPRVLRTCSCLQNYLTHRHLVYHSASPSSWRLSLTSCYYNVVVLQGLLVLAVRDSNSQPVRVFLSALLLQPGMQSSPFTLFNRPVLSSAK